MKRRETSHTPKRKSPRKPSSAHQNDNQTRQFARPAKMPSAKAQVTGKRLMTSALMENEYLKPPPAGGNLIKARLVIPGKHMLPDGLDAPNALNDIRKSHKVWITNIAPNIFEVGGDSIAQLQRAMDALNQTIHDMRLSNEHISTRYFVQHPSRTIQDDHIRVELDSRPCLVSSAPDGPPDMTMAVIKCLQDLGPNLLSSAEFLMSLSSELRMRACFGFLNIRQKKKNMENELTYQKFATLIKSYSVRGGARMDAWLAESTLFNHVLQHVILHNGTMCLEGVKESHLLTLQLEDTELLVNCWNLPDTVPQLIPSKMSKNRGTRLNWVVVAPDMQFDWSLKVDSYDTSNDIPPELQDLVKNLSLSFEKNHHFGGFHLQIPTVTVKSPDKWGRKVSETRLKTSVTVPLGASPYVIELSITRVWNQLATGMQPEKTGWGIEIYGTQWDEAMNQISPVERRKCWGEGLKNIWIGKDPDLETRFKDFLQLILQIQSHLDGADSHHESTDGLQ